MTKYKHNKFILILIVIGIFTGLFLSYGRHKVEVANKTVDMIFEYAEIESLAGHSGKTLEETMRLFKDSGITSLAVYEITLERLQEQGRISLYNSNDILQKQESGQHQETLIESLLSKKLVLPNEVYIVSPKNEDFLEINEDLNERFGTDRVRVLSDSNPCIVAVKGDYESVTEQHLGILTSQLRKADKEGFSLIVRPTNYQAPTQSNIDAVFNRIDKANVKISGMLFSGKEVLGYPEEMDSVAEKLKERNIILGMTEHPLQLQFDKQEGLVDLAKLVDYNVARLYVIDKTEQEKRLTVKTALRRWALTDEERNIRMNFIRAFKDVSPGKTLLDTNLEYVSLIRDSVEKRGFNFGIAGVFENYFPNKLLYIPIIFGAIAAGVLYLSLLTSYLNERRQNILIVFAGLLFSVPFFMVDITVIRQAVALLAATVFPALAMVWQMKNWEKLPRIDRTSLFSVLFATSWQLAATVFISLIGGLYISSILGDTRFLLEIDIYRGVKLTFILPLIFVTLVFLKRYKVTGEDIENPGGLISQIKELLNYPVYLKTMALLGIGAIVAYIFIGRTGHTAGLPVPNIEVKLRLFLEEVMYARPREKEFLVGHPSFFLAALAAWRSWPHIIYYCLVMGATIGQGCLVETFAHMRTPVMMSFIRGIDGLLLGEVIGILCFMITFFCLPFGYYILRRIDGE